MSQVTVSDLIIDDRSSGSLYANQGSEWRVVTDKVMGGMSSAKLSLDTYHHRQCLRMQGEVSTQNNGGFVQISLSLSNQGLFDASLYQGIELEVAGNGESYNLHLRSTGLEFPWQSYRSTFNTGSNWQKIRIPFDCVTPYKTDLPFRSDQLQRIGLVAIGREFDVNLYLAAIRLYADR